jgi:putative PIN family toxin of toxin-antitoxin system
MKVVIDTNCLLSCIGKKSPFRNVFDAFLKGKLTIAVNFEILLEYEEMFTNFWGEDVAYNLLGLFEVSDNFEQVQVFYNFKMIQSDEDDNKFVDTYIAAGATYLVSNDNSITSLKGTTFPPLTIVTLEEFSKILK